jgi:hypothetical protein
MTPALLRLDQAVDIVLGADCFYDTAGMSTYRNAAWHWKLADKHNRDRFRERSGDCIVSNGQQQQAAVHYHVSPTKVSQRKYHRHLMSLLMMLACS